MKSAPPQDIVALVNDLLAGLAIAIAVFFGWLDNRRFNKEKREQLRKEQEAAQPREVEAIDAKAKYLRIALAIVEDTEQELAVEISRIEESGFNYIDWGPNADLPRQMAIAVESLKPFNASLKMIPR